MMLDRRMRGGLATRTAVACAAWLGCSFAAVQALPLPPQEGGAADPRTIDLRPLARANERYDISEHATWSDSLVRLRIQSGDEILIDIDAQTAEPALALERKLSWERAFEDAVEAISERDGAAQSTRLLRTYKKLEGEVRVSEGGAERGRRLRRLNSPLAGRQVNLSRNEEGLVSANLRPKQPTPGQQEAPIDPPATDLALCSMDARLESALPGAAVALDASWPLPLEATRALLGNLDGFPFPRAESYASGIGDELRPADPLAVFLQRGEWKATGRLLAFDESSASVGIEIVVRLDQAALYRTTSTSPNTEAPSASESVASPSMPWSGELRASGRLTFDRARRQVQACVLSGSYELSIGADGAEGTARAHLELATKGTFEHQARIFPVSS